MPVPIKRRVKALKEVQVQYEELMKDFIKERAALQAKYEQAAGGCGRGAGCKAHAAVGAGCWAQV
jgi:hypothetical protein